MGSRPKAKEYDLRGQYDANRCTTSHMVCSISDTTLEDNAVTVETFYLGQSVGDVDEIT